MNPNSRSSRRAKRYSKKSLQYHPCSCKGSLWLARRRAAKRGYGPQQLRGKTYTQIMRLIYNM